MILCRLAVEAVDFVDSLNCLIERAGGLASPCTPPLASLSLSAEGFVYSLNSPAASRRGAVLTVYKPLC